MSVVKLVKAFTGKVPLGLPTRLPGTVGVVPVREPTGPEAAAVMEPPEPPETKLLQALQVARVVAPMVARHYQPCSLAVVADLVVRTLPPDPEFQVVKEEG